MPSYNVRLYDYPTNQQVRIYQRPVRSESETVKDFKARKRKEEDSSMREKIPEQRSEAAAAHSRQVSQNRTKQSVYEITRANTWEWFITLTFDREKIDSSDYSLVSRTVRRWFNNMQQRKAPDLIYMIIPELHKDGIHYHFHSLLACTGDLAFVESGVVQDGKMVYNLPDFRLGFTTATKVEDTHRAAAYVTKYITKELETAIRGKRRFLASRSCRRAKIYEYNMTPEEKNDILFQISDDITHMNTQLVGAAHQQISYIELKK